MYYWNQDNFEGLSAIATVLQGDARYESLARYCDLRERGLRRDAFAALDAFLQEVAAAGVEAQREIALRILEIHWSAPCVHQFLSRPLRQRFIEPVLEQWRQAEPDRLEPLRTLALLRRDRELLEDALQRDPRDDRIRAALAADLLGYVDHATHHLVESSFIGDEAAAAAALQQASALLEGAADAAAVRDLVGQAARFSALLSDWAAYRASPVGSFPDWCRERGRAHDWWTIVYYER